MKSNRVVCGADKEQVAAGRLGEAAMRPAQSMFRAQHGVFGKVAALGDGLERVLVMAV